MTIFDGTDEPSERRSVLGSMALSVSSFLESAGLWLLVVLASIFLLGALSIRMEKTVIAQSQRDRVLLTLTELQETLESDLAFGLDLPEDRRAQGLIERSLERDAQLRAIDVTDPAGRALFSTDRGVIGEAAYPAVERAATASRDGASWLAEVSGETVMGLPLRGPFGATAGHVTTTFVGASVDGFTAGQETVGSRHLFVLTLTLMAAAVLLAVPLMVWSMRQHRRRIAVQRSNDLPEVETRAAAILVRLDACLALLDESERLE